MFIEYFENRNKVSILEFYFYLGIFFLQTRRKTSSPIKCCCFLTRVLCTTDQNDFPKKTCTFCSQLVWIQIVNKRKKPNVKQKSILIRGDIWKNGSEQNLS